MVCLALPDAEEDGAGEEESRGSCQHSGYLWEREDGSAEEVWRHSCRGGATPFMAESIAEVELISV